MTTTMRTRFVEDLAPGDRFSVDGLRAVVRSAVPDETGDNLIISLVNSSDERDVITLSLGTKVEIL
ncbi:hypothetical protein [Gordonia insulae]|uniref:Glycosidase n=1 Tax=Gordonia insulae TaxID=2420509 RepID=A0A3G8JF35_9ACTN|nr:hypothetical protein [Gordonia insulae]AZG43633.1 hypothetical protein D7316_00202 [Gordonia insulae]